MAFERLPPQGQLFFTLRVGGSYYYYNFLFSRPLWIYEACFHHGIKMDVFFYLLFFSASQFWLLLTILSLYLTNLSLAIFFFKEFWIHILQFYCFFLQLWVYISRFRLFFLELWLHILQLWDNVSQFIKLEGAEIDFVNPLLKINITERQSYGSLLQLYILHF